MKSFISVLTIAVFAMMVLAEPIWAITTWSNPGVNPTTIPPGKAVGLFKGLSEVQKLKIACAVATTPSHSIFLLPGDQLTEMTEGNNGVKSFVSVGGIDTLWGQCWVMDGIEVIQFVACNNLAWRQYCPPTLPLLPCPTPTEAVGSVTAPAFPSTATDVFQKIPWPLWIVALPAAGLYALGKFIFGSDDQPTNIPGSGS